MEFGSLTGLAAAAGPVGFSLVWDVQFLWPILGIGLEEKDKKETSHRIW
jgi:hypothetical protein